MKLQKHKKKLAAALILSVAAAISISLLLPGKPVEETVREREYTAMRDTITVGVESSGLVDAAPNAHSFEAGTVVEELLVKVGSEVKKGDPLARLSEEALKEQLEAAQAELSDAKAALQQASGSKDLLIFQNDKTKQDGLAGVQQEYAAKAELLQAEKSRLEADIVQQETTLTQLEQQITDTSAQTAELEERIGSLQAAINQNILEIGRLNEELLQSESSTQDQKSPEEPSTSPEPPSPASSADAASAPATAGDPAALRLEITKLQNENTAMQQEVDAYLADPAFAHLEQLLAQQQICEESLKSSREALSLQQEEISRTEKQRQQALEKQTSDNAFADYKTGEELKSMEENITKASRNVQAAQEKVDRLQTLGQNPVLCAQLDGIVTAVNYKAGDTVVEGKPLCMVGNPTEITMTVPVSAADIGSVSVGQKVNIYVDAYAEQKFTGTVKERLLAANDNGEYPVTISIDPGDHLLLPGMKAYATIILKEKADVLTLSNKAITLENGRQYVLVRDEKGELVRKPVTTGFSDGRVSEILDGLSENEVVIVQE